MLCTDGSNYAQYDFTPDQLGAWQAAGVGLHLEQALTPPSGYPRGRTQQHVQACLDFGMPVGFYVFWWAGAGTDYLKRQLDLLEPFVGRLARGWNDCEDTTVRRAAGVAVDQILPREHVDRLGRQARPHIDQDHVLRLAASMQGLQDDIAAWFTVLDQFPVYLDRPGTYSGPWYSPAYVDLSPFSGRPFWTAEYDGVADVNRITPWGDHIPPATLKQFVGSTSLAGYGGIDLSVVSDNEAALLTGSPQQPDDQQQKRIEDLTTAVAYMGDNLSDQLYKVSRAKAVRTVADELRRVRTQFAGPRP